MNRQSIATGSTTGTRGWRAPAIVVLAGVLAATCCLAACSARASKEDVLAERLALDGRIEGRTYKAPDRSFKIAVHPDAVEWLDYEARPMRPDSVRVPGNRWVLDGRRSVDGARVDFVTFWSAGESLERWDGYDAHHVEIRRRAPDRAGSAVGVGDGDGDMWALVDQVAARFGRQYAERFGERMTTERIAHGEVESGGRRFVHAAYSYKIKGTVVPSVLSRNYRAYTNVCVFRPSADVTVVTVGEIAGEGRDVNEGEREQRVSRDGCDLTWLGSLQFPELRIQSDDTAG